MPLNIQKGIDGFVDTVKKKAEEIEAEIAKKKEEKKSNEMYNINSALKKVDDGFDEVISKLSLVSNILSDDILINGEVFKKDEIENIKEQISTMSN